jgi:hypothetical protein
MGSVLVRMWDASFILEIVNALFVAINRLRKKPRTNACGAIFNTP